MADTPLRDRPPMATADGRVFAALALLSLSVTTQQVVLMQVLAWAHWHHFAFMVVALALLGFGLAGTALALFREPLLSRWRQILPWLALGAAAALPLGVRLAQTETLAVDFPLVFIAPRHALRLLALTALLVPAFFCAGLGTALVLTVGAARAGRFYCANLLGAGAGGLVGLALVATLNPPHLAAAASLPALAAAACLWSGLPRRSQPVATVLALVPLILLAFPGNLRPSQFKPLSRALDLPGAHLIAERTSVRGWVQVVAAPALRPAPALSLDYRGEIPVQPAVFVNGLAHGSLVPIESVGNPAWLDYTTDAAAGIPRSPARVLLLETGPDGWAAHAVRHGARRVVIVEPNRVVANLLTDGAKPLAPEWRLPEVEVIVADGRQFLHVTREQFDLIRFPTVGALGGTAGLASAGEQRLLTREAFVAAWRRLAPGGVIAVTSWMDFPERNPLRLLATLAESLETEGASPAAHLAAVRGWATVTFLLRREPWPPADTAELRLFCTARGFDPLLLPDLRPDEREANHVWRNSGFFAMADRLLKPDRAKLYRSYAFDLRPPVDDRPYFSQFLRWRELRRIAAVFGDRLVPFFELGSLVVAVTFVLLCTLAFAGIVLPLARLGWRGPGKTRLALYFGGLGAGFMLVEMGLMLRLQSWLGGAVPAAAVVLTTLLVFSGAGSLLSERWPAGKMSTRLATGAITVLVVSTVAMLGQLDGLAWSLSGLARIAAAVAVLLPLGLAMGMAFPLGLRRVAAEQPAQVPWAWAINGCVSVATPAGALLAMGAGFTAVFAGAAAAYVVAFLGTGAAPVTPPSLSPSRSRPSSGAWKPWA